MEMDSPIGLAGEAMKTSPLCLPCWRTRVTMTGTPPRRDFGRPEYCFLCARETNNGIYVPKHFAYLLMMGKVVSAPPAQEVG
jgi:hypothetical protein